MNGEQDSKRDPQGDFLAYRSMVLEIGVDILHSSTTPQGLAENVCHQMRALTGAKLVAVLITEKQYGEALVVVNPDRRRDLLECDLLTRLRRDADDAGDVLYWDAAAEGTRNSGGPDTLSFTNCMVMPIASNHTPVGSLVLMDIIADGKVPLVVEAVRSLRKVISLTLYTTLMREKQEDVIEARTRELLTSRRRFRTLMDQSRDSFFVTDLRGTIVDVNSKVATMFGFERERLLGRTMGALDPGNALAAAFHTASSMGTEDPNVAAEYSFQHADGSELPVEVAITRLEPEEEKLLLLQVRDISREKETEALINAIYRSVSKTTGQELFDALTETLSVNFNLDHVIVGELVGGDMMSTLSCRIDHRKAPAFTCSIKYSPCSEALAKGFLICPEGVTDRFPLDKRLVDMGAVGYIGVPLKSRKGENIGILCAMSRAELDLPEWARSVFEFIADRAQAEIDRKRADKAMVEQEERLRITLKSIGDAVIATDTQGRIFRMNPVAERLSGWSSPEARGRIFRDVFTLTDRDNPKRTVNPVEDILLPRANGQDTSGQQMVLVARNGEKRSVAGKGAPILDEHGNTQGVVLVLRDTTEYQKLQEQLIQSRKMDSIGQLAGGIAHDFNNMLTCIMGAAEVIENRLPPGEERLRRNVEIISGAANKAALMTKQLLDFARKGKAQTIEVNMHEIIHDSCNLLTRSLDKIIEVKQHLDAQSVQVQGDPAQLQNVIINLAVNARDAMPQGGTIEIRTANISLDKAFCSQSPLNIEPGDYLQVTIQDTGTGIPGTILDRIFEPFFSTKGAGGTGLGLSVVYGTVNDHGGFINCYSEVGHGTVFKIYLPVCELSLAEVDRSDDGQAIKKGEGTVLVVDDEELVANAAREILEELGYAAIESNDGAEAIALYEAEYRNIDLVLMDVIMPKLSGYDVYRRMREINPDIRIVFSSGFTRNKLPEEVLAETNVKGFVEKPYRISHFSSVVTRAIQGAS